MPYATYDDMSEEFTRLYSAQKYGAAYELLTAESGNFPDQIEYSHYLRSCMAARNGQQELAIALIQEAFDRGTWYGDNLMRNSPSYASLQGRPEFEQIAAASKAKQDEVQGHPQTLVAEPEGGCGAGQKCPLIIALHGNASDGPSAFDPWQPVTNDGWLLAAIQSGQATMGGRQFIWDDQQQALQEIAQEYGKLDAQYSIDSERVIVAGFSLGGETALLAALKGAIAAKGFILLGPGGPLTDEPESWRPIVQAATVPGLRGYVMIGERETPAVHEQIRALVTLLNAEGISCEMATIPGVAHDYSPDFMTYVGFGLAYIEGR